MNFRKYRRSRGILPVYKDDNVRISVGRVSGCLPMLIDMITGQHDKDYIESETPRERMHRISDERRRK